MFDVLKRVTAVRLAAAGREARREVVATAGQIGAQVADAAATAAGELVRCAVAGAITAVVRGSHPTPSVGSVGAWDHTEFDDNTGDDGDDTPPVPAPESGSAAFPGWARTSRVASRALTVAAGAAAAVPGGRLVAAGLGAAAAVVGLVARATENAPTDNTNDNN